MITKDYLLEEMKNSANVVASKNMLTEDERLLLIEEGYELISNIFDSLSWTTIIGKVMSFGHLDEWHHRRTASEIENDWRFLVIDRALLIDSAEKYLYTNWINNKYLDWLFVNLLIYAEYQGFIDTILSKLLLSFDEYMSLKSSTDKSPIVLRIKPKFSFLEFSVMKTH